MRRVLGLVACSAILVSGLLMISSKAIAAIQVPEQHPGLISIWTDSYSLDFQDIDPGESIYIRLDVELDGADRGDLTLQVNRSGTLVDNEGLEIGVERCDDTWTAVPSGVTTLPAPSCASNQRMLVWLDPDDSMVSGTEWAVGEVTSTEVAHLMVTLSVPSTTPMADVRDDRAIFAFGLFAEGDSVAVLSSSPRLALTGLDALSIALIAIGAIGAGAIATRARRSEVTS